jgi:HPt (histidine-containing phosphotransfer) domain-containing protein
MLRAIHRELPGHDPFPPRRAGPEENPDVRPVTPASGEPLSSPDWIDRQVLAELYELEQSGEPGLVRSLIEGFRISGTAEIALIHAALDQSDARALQRVAHRFKGTAAIIGANFVAQHCLALERLGRQGTVEGGKRLVEELTKEYNKANSALLELEENGPWNRELSKPSHEALS